MSSSGAAPGGESGAHVKHELAESFGVDPELYDRARPRYPDALIERLSAGAAPGVALDVGTATGIVARQLQAAGWRVLGVDPDARLAAYARARGVEVEVARFEDWEPAGRAFDAVVSGESWHWVDPRAGAARAAQVLRPGGRLALFWNTGEPQGELEQAFDAVYRRVLPAALASHLGRAARAATHEAMCAGAEDGIRGTGAFAAPERWRFEWAQEYSREAWLDALRTSGGAVEEGRLTALLEGIGGAIDAAGGRFAMRYTTLVVTAVRLA